MAQTFGRPKSCINVNLNKIQNTVNLNQNMSARIKEEKMFSIKSKERLKRGATVQIQKLSREDSRKIQRIQKLQCPISK